MLGREGSVRWLRKSTSKPLTDVRGSVTEPQVVIEGEFYEYNNKRRGYRHRHRRMSGAGHAGLNAQQVDRWH